VEMRSDSLSVVKRWNGDECGISEGWSVLKHIRMSSILINEVNRCADVVAHIECDLFRFFYGFLQVISDSNYAYFF
jgi:hypothetical protein